MIFYRRAESHLAFPVWARGGQAPLRAQASLRSGHLPEIFLILALALALALALVGLASASAVAEARQRR